MGSPTCPYCMQRVDRCACEDPRIVGYENAPPTPSAPADAKCNAPGCSVCAAGLPHTTHSYPMTAPAPADDAREKGLAAYDALNMREKSEIAAQAPRYCYAKGYVAALAGRADDARPMVTGGGLIKFDRRAEDAPRESAPASGEVFVYRPASWKGQAPDDAKGRDDVKWVCRRADDASGAEAMREACALLCESFKEQLWSGEAVPGTHAGSIATLLAAAIRALPLPATAVVGSVSDQAPDEGSTRVEESRSDDRPTAASGDSEGGGRG